MAPEFVARTRGSKWQSALPTGGSKWQPALPAGVHKLFMNCLTLRGRDVV